MFYLASGYIINNDYKNRKKILARIPKNWTVYITPTQKNHYNLVISAHNRNTAYNIAFLIRGFYTIIINSFPYGMVDHDFMLYEFSKFPSKNWKKNQWINYLNAKVHSNIFSDHQISSIISSGTCIFANNEVEIISKYLLKHYNNIKLIGSLNNLFQSYLLFDGNMVASYYQAHHVLERSNLNKDSLEKAYYELKPTYELAFTSAFKGIERFLNVNDIKKNEVDSILNNTGYDFTKSDKNYERYFEHFSNHNKYITQGEIVRHFLDLRNIVGAHSNVNPPKEKIIISDNIYEIQLFLSNWLRKAINI